MLTSAEAPIPVKLMRMLGEIVTPEVDPGTLQLIKRGSGQTPTGGSGAGAGVGGGLGGLHDWRGVPFRTTLHEPTTSDGFLMSPLNPVCAKRFPVNQ